MSRITVAALACAVILSACTTTTNSVVSSRNYYEPVFVPVLNGPR